MAQNFGGSMKFFESLLGIAVVGLLCGAMPRAVDAASPFWVRDAQVSPDGATVAFTYRGQIWIVPSEGGDALPLTERQFRSTAPVWSPDSSRIAFASDRFNVSDVFVMPVEGGEITRLTHHSAADTPLAFSADGREVFFRAARQGGPEADYLDGLGQPVGVLMKVAVDGGRERMVLPLPMAQADLSPDGRTLAYVERKTVETPWRKGEMSDSTPDIWLYDLESGSHDKLTTYRGVDRSPAFAPDGQSLYWTTEMPQAGIEDPNAAPGTFNIWRGPLDGGAPEQVTSHDTLPVRFASVAEDGTLVYTWDTQLWRLDPGAQEPVPVPVNIRQGTLYTGEVFIDLAGQVSEAVASPDGSEIALIARGEVFVASPATGEVRRITDTPQAEHSVSYAPDGKRLLYAAERAGDWDIYETGFGEADTGFLTAVTLTERRVIDTQSDALQPAYAPDGQRIAYRDDRNAIRIFDPGAGTSTEILPDSASYFYTVDQFDFEWSPDGKHILTTTGFISTNTEIEMIETTGAHRRQNLSDSGFGDGGAGFSPDGSVVFWQSDRFSQRNLSSEAAMVDIMATWLTAEGYLARDLGEATAAEEGAEPDFDGVPYRTSRITGRPVLPILTRMTADNSGLLLVTLQITSGTIEAELIDLATGRPRQVFAKPVAGIEQIIANKDASTLFLIKAGSIETVQVAGGASTQTPFQLRASFDPVAEMRYIFDHHWRFVQSKFYDAALHGVDWTAMRDAYAKYLPHLTHWEDFVTLMNELQGELNASHMGARFDHDNPGWDSTAELGLYYDTAHAGAGVKIAATLPGGPAALARGPLGAGAVILAVDGVEIGPEQDIHPLLNRMAGRKLRLTVAPADGGAAVDVTLRAAAAGSDGELAYHAWVETRRAMVLDLSGGRLGYTHVRRMMDDSYRQVYSDLMGRDRDKEGAIVDTRFNFGGNLHDQLSAFLTGTRHSGLVTRNGVDLGTTPYLRWAKPSALLMNTWNYSDASVFPYYYMREGMGPAVGDRVPGTGTAVLRPDQLEKRVVLGVPQLGFRTVEGDFFENREIVPDEVVHTSPEAMLSGRDPQLEAAVAALLRALGE